MALTPKWLVVGGDTLLGKEVREVAVQQQLPVTVEASASGQKERVLTQEEGELVVMEPLSEEVLTGAQVLLLAGEAASQRVALELLAKLGESPVIVDLTGGSEKLPHARLRAPLLGGAGKFPKKTLWVVPHPAALILGRCVTIVHARFPVRHAVATVLEPASAQGNRGVDELQQQTISLLSFQNMPKDVFDAQVSFNLLPRFGEDAKVSIQKSNERLERHLTALLEPQKIPVPSVRVVHAPVFHGYGIQLWIEFESRPESAAIEEVLREAGLDVRNKSVEPPSNLAVAGHSGISIDEIGPDRNHPRAAWLWLAADNLRTVADNALLVAGLAVRGQ